MNMASARVLKIHRLLLDRGSSAQRTIALEKQTGRGCTHDKIFARIDTALPTGIRCCSTLGNVPIPGPVLR